MEMATAACRRIPHTTRPFPTASALPSSARHAVRAPFRLILVLIKYPSRYTVDSLAIHTYHTSPDTVRDGCASFLANAARASNQRVPAEYQGDGRPCSRHRSNQSINQRSFQRSSHKATHGYNEKPHPSTATETKGSKPCVTKYRRLFRGCFE